MLGILRVASGAIPWVTDPGYPRGMPTADLGGKTYYLARFLLKTAWKWKKIDQNGAHASLVLPRPANAALQTVLDFMQVFFEKLAKLIVCTPLKGKQRSNRDFWRIRPWYVQALFLHLKRRCEIRFPQESCQHLYPAGRALSSHFSVNSFTMVVYDNLLICASADISDWTLKKNSDR